MTTKLFVFKKRVQHVVNQNQFIGNGYKGVRKNNNGNRNGYRNSSALLLRYPMQPQYAAKQTKATSNEKLAAPTRHLRRLNPLV